MGNILGSEQLLAGSTRVDESTGSSTPLAADKPLPKKPRSLNLFYVGLAWAFGYPATALLIGYAVSVTSGGPAA